MSERWKKSELIKIKQFQGLFDYSGNFRQINPSSKLYFMKCIFSNKMVFMLHITFNLNTCLVSNQPGLQHNPMNDQCGHTPG